MYKIPKHSIGFTCSKNIYIQHTFWQQTAKHSFFFLSLHFQARTGISFAIFNDAFGKIPTNSKEQINDWSFEVHILYDEHDVIIFHESSDWEKKLHVSIASKRIFWEKIQFIWSLALIHDIPDDHFVDSNNNCMHISACLFWWKKNIPICTWDECHLWLRSIVPILCIHF